jgi:hypothetical protein
VRGDEGALEFRLCNLQFLSWKTSPEVIEIG